ncbi:MAG: hypothetical protein ACFFEV_01400 [Candidatus Thorarchaeota archaeon]
MSESNVIKRFKWSLEECEKDHVYSGTILEFDQEDYAPRDQFLEGMLVTSRKGTRRVNFFIPKKSKPIIDVSSLKVNDFVHVFGRKDESRSNSTTPSLIMAPDRTIVIFANRRDMFTWRGERVDYVQALSYLITIVLSVISQFFVVLSLGILPLGPAPDSSIWFLVGVVAYMFLFLTLGVDWYRSRLGNPISIHCDNETWNHLNDIVSEKYGSL